MIFYRENLCLVWLDFGRLLGEVLERHLAGLFVERHTGSTHVEREGIAAIFFGVNLYWGYNLSWGYKMNLYGVALVHLLRACLSELEDDHPIARTAQKPVA